MHCFQEMICFFNRKLTRRQLALFVYRCWFHRGLVGTHVHVYQQAPKP